MSSSSPSDGKPDAGSWARAEALFAELLELESTARVRRLELIRADEPEVAAWVERLLRADSELSDEEEEGFLAPRRDLRAWIGDEPPADSSIYSLSPGDEVGPFVIEAGIGRGGMGEVFRARRREAPGESGFEQTVALKLIRPGGGSSDEVRRRFFRERRILARLTHPAIGRLLDGGTAADGRPYFAMELIDGVPITRFCTEHGLSIRRRLELFGEVCGAVQFAHENFVVHRDLKPSNVLVVDAGTGSGHTGPSVKLLDFGIAGLLQASVDEGLTRTGMAPATPQYAAPEQLRGEPVQAATDVYSLGVLLFELITGERPEHWPPLAAGESLHAPPSPRKLAGSSSRDCPRDLAAIVMRAIEVDPEHRYGSVAALSADLERFLEGRPVQARKGTRWYRTGKFLARNRVAVVFATLAVVALVTGLVSSRLQADEARRQAERARRSTELLTRVFEGSDPAATRGREVTALDLLDAGAEQIDSELDDDPELRAELQTVLARIYRALGAYQNADGLARSALEAAQSSGGDELRRRALLELARSEVAVGRPAQALELLRDEVSRTPSPGASELEVDLRAVVASALLELGRAQEALEITSGLETSSVVSAGRAARILGLQADAHVALGRAQEAMELHRRVVERLELELEFPHPLLAQAWSDLGVALFELAQNEESARFLRRALDARRQLYGERHAEVADALRNLSGPERALGNGVEGRAMLEEAISIYRDVFGPAHPDVAESINNLAVATAQAGDLRGAVPLFEEAIEVNRALFGSSHPGLILPLASLGNLLTNLGRPSQAEVVLDEARELSVELLAADHPQRALVANQMAGLRAKQGRLEEAVVLLGEALAGFRASLGEKHPNVGIVLATLGQYELALAEPSSGSLESPLGYLEEAATLLEAAPAPLRGHYERALVALGEALFRVGREDEAVAVWRRTAPEDDASVLASAEASCAAARVVQMRPGWRSSAEMETEAWARELGTLVASATSCE